MHKNGRLGGTGYLSILPVIRASNIPPARASRKTRITSIPRTSSNSRSKAAATPSLRRLACLGIVARKYAHKIPFIVKINHNELLTYPNNFDQIMFGSVKQAYDMGAAGIGATIYFGSEESHAKSSKSHRRSPTRTNSAWRRCCGAICATTRSRQGQGLSRLRRSDRAGESSRRDHRSRHHQAKLAENNGGYLALNTKASRSANWTSACTANLPAIIRLTSAATRWRTAIWDAPA